MPGGPPPPWRRKPLAEHADDELWLQAAGVPGFLTVLTAGAVNGVWSGPVWKQLLLAVVLLVLWALAIALAVPAWWELARRGSGDRG